MVKKIFIRTVIIIATLLIFAIIFLYGVGKIVYKDENPLLTDIVTLSLLETSAAKFVPSIFISQQEIDDIVKNNTVDITTDTTDSSLVSIEINDNTVELIEFTGSTYVGRMIVISDPSRVYMATPEWGFDSKIGGMTVAEYIERDDAIAGINAGGFSDSKGSGNGGIPSGYVIENGELTYGELSTVDCVTGFDKDGKLIVGKMSAKDAIETGIIDGFCFSLSGVGPLIVNGEPVEISGTGSGLNPRTAIGQKADGTIILLTIDGRQAHSLGAVYSDIIDIFLANGVINASNLDGGSSSMMIYEDEVVSVSSSLVGVRQLPTAILVK